MGRLKRQTYYKVFGVVSAAAIAGFGVLNLLAPDREYSSAEKRSLAAFPELRLSRVLDGSFMEQFDAYETDQFVGRDMWMVLKTGVERLTGKNESQGVYLCDDGYLMERFDEPDAALMEKTAQAVLDFHSRFEGADTYFLLVPNSISVEAELLPDYALTADQNAYIDRFYEALGEHVRTLDVRALFQEKKEEVQLYYRTDHHWTTDAAYEAFLSVADEMGLVTDSYQSGIVTNTFNGSLTSESGFFAAALDSIRVYLPEKPVDYVVTYVEEQKRTVTCYQTDCLEGDDPYQLFFGGNHPQIKIDTDADTDRTLLVLKDSYANCFIPFLLSSFKQITIVDPRYYYDDLDLLMQQKQYTDVLYLYNVNTLAADNNLYAVLENGQ